MDNIPLETVLWVSGILTGIIGFLATIIGWVFYGKLSALETRVDINHKEIQDKQKDIEHKHETEHKDLTSKIDLEAQDRREKHDIVAIRAFEKIEKIEEKVSDLGVTAAGFGSLYVTRTEYNQDKKASASRGG